MMLFAFSNSLTFIREISKVILDALYYPNLDHYPLSVAIELLRAYGSAEEEEEGGKDIALRPSSPRFR